MASCIISPSRYQVISAAGLAPDARHVRLWGVWALRRTTGPPSTTGSDGGTEKELGDFLLSSRKNIKTTLYISDVDVYVSSTQLAWNVQVSNHYGNPQVAYILAYATCTVFSYVKPYPKAFLTAMQNHLILPVGPIENNLANGQIDWETLAFSEKRLR